jgi:hypothetical protein
VVQHETVDGDTVRMVLRDAPAASTTLAATR